MYLIVGGGGNKISYLLGIKKYFEDKEIKFKKFSGSSSGAIFCLLIICNISNQDIINHYYKIQIKALKAMKSIECKLDYIKYFLQGIIPSNAYQLCSNKLYVSTTEVDSFSWKNKFFNQFDNNNDLINCILASCSVPYVINNKFFFKMNGKNYLDGSFSREAHLFVKNNSKNQIIIKPWFHTPLDNENFDYKKKISNKSMAKGYLDMKSFIEKGETYSQFCISNNLQDTKLMIFFLLLIYIYSTLLNE